MSRRRWLSFKSFFTLQDFFLKLDKNRCAGGISIGRDWVGRYSGGLVDTNHSRPIHGRGEKTKAHEAQAVQNGLYYPRSYSWATQRAHVAGYRDEPSDRWIIINKHICKKLQGYSEEKVGKRNLAAFTFINILYTSLYSVGGFTENCAPQLSVNHHDSRQESDFSFRILRKWFRSPWQQFQITCSYTVA